MHHDEHGEQKRLLVSEERAAQILCVGYAALKRARVRGRIPYHRIGDRVLYSRDDLRQILEVRKNEQGRFN